MFYFHYEVDKYGHFVVSREFHIPAVHIYVGVYCVEKDNVLCNVICAAYKAKLPEPIYVMADTYYNELHYY